VTGEMLSAKVPEVNCAGRRVRYPFQKKITSKVAFILGAAPLRPREVEELLHLPDQVRPVLGKHQLLRAQEIGAAVQH